MSFKKLALGAVLFALNYVESKFIKKIKDEFVRENMRLLLKPIRQMIEAFRDENPKDAEQVRELWRQFVNEEVTNTVQTELLDLIEDKIKSDNFKRVARALTFPTVDLLRIITDKDPNNGDQAKEILTAFITDERTHELVLQDLLEPTLSKLLEPALVAFILELIEQGIEAAIDKLEEDKRKAILKSLKASQKKIQASAA